VAGHFAAEYFCIIISQLIVKRFFC